MPKCTHGPRHDFGRNVLEGDAGEEVTVYICLACEYLFVPHRPGSKMALLVERLMGITLKPAAKPRGLPD